MTPEDKLPKWAADMEPIGMADAARVLGICKRTLTDMLKDHPHYELRGRVKKVFYPEHIMQLRKVRWRSNPDLGQLGFTVLSAPSGARVLERARRHAAEKLRSEGAKELERACARLATKQQRRPPPSAFEKALETVNLPTLSPRMKEALAFVATKGLAGKKNGARPHLATFEALKKRGMIIQGTTDYNHRLTDEGRRALEAIQSGRNLFGSD